MSDFAYVAKDSAGSRLAGSIAAGSERDVLDLLIERGLTPLSIRLAPATRPMLPARKGVSRRAMVRTYRQLSDLLRSGVPLLRSLELVEKQAIEPPLTAAFAEIRKRVADGDGLAESFAAHPALFDDLAVSMVKAGQEGGFLEDVLSRIADYTEREAELKAKVAGAMAYPLFLALVGTLVISILVIFFVPKFGKIFARLREKGQLPALTTGLLATSDFLQSYGLVLVAGAGAAGYGAIRWMKSKPGRETVDRFKVRSPKIGELFRDLAIVRFARVLGTLLANGIPILSALTIAKDSCGNVVMSRAIADAAANITSGQSLTDPLRASGCFPPDVVAMVAIAEESNTLERVLIDISETTERKTTRQLELFVRLLEPLMLLVMAAVTLVVVAALLLPVMKMSTALR